MDAVPLFMRSLTDMDAATVRLDLTASSARFAGDGWLYFLADRPDDGMLSALHPMHQA